MPGNFSQIGNLAFYDGWSPNYVYFKSLLSRAWADSNPNGTWNTELAGERAATAVMDAVTYSVPFNMTEEESNKYFLDKFTAIIAFLEQAVAAERASETAYLKQLLKDLKKSFKLEERKKITALQNLEKLIEAGMTDDGIKYDAINTLINVLLQGFDNTHTLIDYEQDRIKKIDDMVRSLIDSRGAQAAGLGKAQKKDVIDQIAMADRAKSKLERKIIVEYATTGQLTRKNTATGKYVLFGGKGLETNIPKAIDRVFADWTERMINKICTDKKFLGKVRARIQGNYPKDANFNWLENDVQEDIIQAVIAYGMKDFSTILNEIISDELIKDFEKRTLNGKNNLLDTVTTYNINGLDATFGRYVHETELMKEAHSLADLKDNHATELLQGVKRLINQTKEYNVTAKKSDSYLVQAMSSTKGKNGENTLERAENIITLIDAVEKLKQEMAKAKREWSTAVKKANNKTIELSKEAKISKKAKATIKITVKNGEVKIDQSTLLTALREDNRFKNSMAFKDFNPQTLNSTIGTLKARASKILKDDIINSLKNAKFKIPENELVEQVSREMKSITVHINGPTLAELMTGIYFTGTSEKMMVDWNRYKGKNDSVAITISHGKFVHKFHLTDFYQAQMYTTTSPIMEIERKIEAAQLNLVKEYQANIDKSVQWLTNSNDMQKYSKMIGIMNTDITNDNAQTQELANAYKELEDTVNELKQELKRSHADIDPSLINNMANEYLHTLQNAFYVSTTVKSANDYVNQLGFKGGTLGSSLDAQLSRISDIFESAGMPIDPKDMMWIRSAILNCFPGSVVGEKNKNLIENYLGALMAFALFDEGGAETAIIDKFKVDIAKAIRTGKAQKVVHLYVTDGMYIKGSTVLQRTLNTLKNEVIPNIKNIPATMRRGAGVVIINRASESMIPNRPYKDYVNNGADSGAWGITGERVASQVTIQILFLAGLLDIIEGINNALSQVELPA